MLLEKPKTYFIDRLKKLTLTNISNLVYADEAHTRVECVVVFQEFPLEPMPFSADKFDAMAHGREIFNDILSGEFGQVTPYVAPVVPKEPELPEEDKVEEAPAEGGAA